MQTKTIFFSIIFSIFFHNLLSVNMIQSLEKECPMQSKVASEFESKKLEYQNLFPSSEFPTQNLPTFYHLKNINTLVNHLFSETKPTGKGTFGMIYMINYIEPTYHDSDEVASKVVRFPDDLSEKKNQARQHRLALEVQANKIMYHMPLGKFFFPAIYACFEFTNLVDEMAKNVDFENINKYKKKNISHHENEGMLTIITEPLFMSMADFLELSYDDKVDMEAEDKLNLFYQAIKGLMIMDSQFFHCDIKPSNIMFKGLSSEGIKEMASANIFAARFNEDQYFQLKYIDFGMIAPGNRNERQCPGGTSGFIPDEYLQKNVSHQKFDVYSLGMSFLDMELASLGYEQFSQIDSILFKNKKKKLAQLTQEEINELEDFNLVSRMKEIMIDSQYQSIFFDKLKQIDPSINLAKENKNINYNSNNLNELMKKNATIFRSMMMAAMRIYFTEEYREIKIPAMIQNLEEKIEEINKKISLSSDQQIDVTKLKLEIEYIQNLKTLTPNAEELGIALNNLYLDMITADMANRPSLNDVYLQLEQIKNEFLSNNNELLDEIKIYENDIESEESIEPQKLEVMAQMLKKRVMEPVLIKEEIYQNKSIQLGDFDVKKNQSQLKSLKII